MKSRSTQVFKLWLTIILFPLLLQAKADSTSFFPESIPEVQDISPQLLHQLSAVVDQYYRDGQFVGAELLVIKNHRTIWHDTFGWRDREDSLAMEKNTIFNIRSMTKPVTATAAYLLIEKGKLHLTDHVAQYIPGFNTDQSRRITIEQLMTHTSGLPLTILKTAADYPDLLTMANAIGEQGPQFKPGSKFWYSDAGFDVLGAVVEQVAEQPLDEFIEQQIFTKLEMHDTFFARDPEDPRWSRIAALYGGRLGSWTKFWAPQDGKPFYTFAWGSQTLYSTPMDYAKFLSLFLDNGENDTRLLTSESVSQILTPVSLMTSLGSDMQTPTGFYDMQVHYGQAMSLYVDSNENPENGVLAFGHTGSDGTYAWVWPEHDLMVLFFTQSRGGASGLRLESVIDELLIRPEMYKSHSVPEQYRPYIATYVANFGPYHNEEFEVKYFQGKLALDIPSQIIYTLREPDEKGRWFYALTRDVYLTFDADESGTVTQMRLHSSGKEFLLPRGKAPAEQVISLADVQPFLGLYRDENNGRDTEILFNNAALVVKTAEGAVLELFPPDQDGWWAVRMNPTIKLKFNRSDDGTISSLTSQVLNQEFNYKKLTE